jgi:hypothetical protein
MEDPDRFAVKAEPARLLFLTLRLVFLHGESSFLE